jgi:hypothetical protein
MFSFFSFSFFLPKKYLKRRSFCQTLIFVTSSTKHDKMDCRDLPGVAIALELVGFCLLGHENKDRVGVLERKARNLGSRNS